MRSCQSDRNRFSIAFLSRAILAGLPAVVAPLRSSLRIEQPLTKSNAFCSRETEKGNCVIGTKDQEDLVEPDGWSTIRITHCFHWYYFGVKKVALEQVFGSILRPFEEAWCRGCDISDIDGLNESSHRPTPHRSTQ